VGQVRSQCPPVTTSLNKHPLLHNRPTEIREKEMPNWVTNKVAAATHVIEAMVNEEGKIDFNLMAPFPGPRGADWNGIYGDAETAANAVLNTSLSSHPLIASLESANRRDVNIEKMTDTSFQQFIGMLENYRACGYLHGMDWAREKWGTKWNACEPEHDEKAGIAKFDTAWSCPEGVLTELSKRFPEDAIIVTFADGDIGSNCGSFILKAGNIISSDIAPSRQSMNTEDQKKWRMFAYRVKGYSDSEIAEFENEEE